MQNDKLKLKKEFKKRLYYFVLELIKLVDTLPKDNITKIFVNQLIRSGTSILSNYIEGQSSSSKKEFINFFTISLKSTNESKVWIAILKDTDRITSKKAEWYLSELDQFSRIFASSILTLKGKK